MFNRKILACLMVIICFCLLGCGSDKDTDSKTVKKSNLIDVTIHGEKTNLNIKLPFDVPNTPKDVLDTLPPDLRGVVILKAQHYQSGNNSIALNASYSTFNDEVFSNFSEDDLYNSLNQEMQDNFGQLRSNSRFSDLVTDHQRTKISGQPAIIATINYVSDGKNKFQSKLVYIFKDSELWRLVFDYRQSDSDSAATVDNAVKSIKL